MIARRRRLPAIAAGLLRRLGEERLERTDDRVAHAGRGAASRDERHGRDDAAPGNVSKKAAHALILDATPLKRTRVNAFCGREMAGRKAPSGRDNRGTAEGAAAKAWIPFQLDRPRC